MSTTPANGQRSVGLILASSIWTVGMAVVLLAARPSRVEATEEPTSCRVEWCSVVCEVNQALCGWEYCCFTRSCPQFQTTCPLGTVLNSCKGFSGPC